jgi:hypothetical protein
MEMGMQANNTAKYIELASRTYELILDTLASATRSRITYWKSVWEIASRPYASRTIGARVQENFDRTSELTNLTVDELHSRAQRAVDFSKKLLNEAEQLQDTTGEIYRDSSTSIGSAVGQEPIVAAKDLSVDGVSTVEHSSNGRRTFENLVSVTN